MTLSGLNFWDGVVLISTVLVCLWITLEDIQHQQFPLILWLVFTLLGGLWCWKQTFIPLALAPLGLGVGCIFLYNRCVHEIMGSGDLLLFLSSGLFLPMNEISFFVVLAGAFGLVGFGLRKILHKKDTPLPFAGSILGALIVTFCITFFGRSTS